ncbi:hypothetical protein WDW37_21090, partial [Bdellovibrionota bacterium FG-1]
YSPGTHKVQQIKSESKTDITYSHCVRLSVIRPNSTHKGNLIFYLSSNLDESKHPQLGASLGQAVRSLKWLEGKAIAQHSI